MPSLTLGDWTLHTLETGYLWLDGGAMFGSVPKPLWSRANPPDEKNRIRLAMRCLLLEGRGRRVLVDVGLGAKNDAKFRDIFRVEEGHSLERALAARGLAAPQIGETLFLSPKTDDHQIQHVYAKIGVTTRAAAAHWGVQNGVVG